MLVCLCVLEFGVLKFWLVDGGVCCGLGCVCFVFGLMLEGLVTAFLILVFEF